MGYECTEEKRRMEVSIKGSKGMKNTKGQQQYRKLVRKYEGRQFTMDDRKFRSRGKIEKKYPANGRKHGKSVKARLGGKKR